MRVKIGSGPGISATVKSPTKIFVNQSGILSQKLVDLSDVDISDAKDGSLLIYNEVEKKFVASNLLEKQEINGGHF
jgi:hypothetical protein